MATTYRHSYTAVKWGNKFRQGKQFSKEFFSFWTCTCCSIVWKCETSANTNRTIKDINLFKCWALTWKLLILSYTVMDLPNVYHNCFLISRKKNRLALLLQHLMRYQKQAISFYIHQLLWVMSLSVIIVNQNLKRLRVIVRNKLHGKLTSSINLLHDNARPHIA